MKTKLVDAHLSRFLNLWQVYCAVPFIFYPCKGNRHSCKRAAALVALFNATGGPQWTNRIGWTTSAPEWYGVKVEGGHVTAIELPVNKLTGTIPAAIADFTYAKYSQSFRE
jgi:hypothetical protein